MIFRTTLYALLLTASSAPADVVVQPLSGDKLAGRLVALDGRRAVIETDGKQRTFPLRDLQTISATETAGGPYRKPAVWITLVDGTRIGAAQYTASGRSATIEGLGKPLKLETRSVRWVRFRPSAESLDAQWREIVSGAIEGDLVVLHRSDTSLDQLEGILHDVDDKTVVFEFDDEKIPVKRTKLEGIVYFRSGERELPEVICKVRDTAGSVWFASSLNLKDSTLQLVTASRVAHALPLADVERLDFSTGNVVFLSDMRPEQVEWTPFLGTRIDAKRLAQLYRPRLDRSFEGEGLWLGSGSRIQRYDKGLCIHSRTRLVYRLGGEFRKLTAIAGIDSRLQGRGNVELVISGDGKELFRKSIRGSDPPSPIELDVKNVQRLTILVDFGQILDVADHLNLCNARLFR